MLSHPHQGGEQRVGHPPDVYEGLKRKDESENFYFADVVILRHRQEMMRLALEKSKLK